MRVLHVLSELYPLIKTGGLADVGGALLPALRRLRVDARPLLPGYPTVLAGCGERQAIWHDANLFQGGPARLLRVRFDAAALPGYVLDAPGFFERPGNPYLDADGRDYADNHLRFAALGWAAALLATGADAAFVPQLVHGHDWQAGLTPAYLRLVHGAHVPSVHTIHNLDYAGAFDMGCRHELGLPQEAFGLEGVEFYGRVSFLKAGLHYSEALTTVSPTYAKEIQTAEKGAGFDGLLRARRDKLWGILNGIDEAAWNPRQDPHLAVTYGLRNLAAKRKNRAALLAQYALPAAADLPTFGVVSRLTWQKGLDLLPAAVSPLLQEGKLRLLVLGTGEQGLENQLQDLARTYPALVGVHLHYDEALAHRLQAGCDALVVPSRSEPCGLTQLCAMRYGTVPIVRRTGGLADTVCDPEAQNLPETGANGLCFEDATAYALGQALSRACTLYANRAGWQQLQRNGMRQHQGWRAPAERYTALYRNVIGPQRRRPAAKT